MKKFLIRSYGFFSERCSFYMTKGPYSLSFLILYNVFRFYVVDLFPIDWFLCTFKEKVFGISILFNYIIN